MSWLFSVSQLADSPSRRDGVNPETEARYRREGAEMIRKLGQALELRPVTFITGIVFFHRFFILQSFKAHNRSITAAACLFLAGKVREQPKKLSVFLPLVHQLMGRVETLDVASADFAMLKDKLLGSERLLLQTFNFDFAMDDPYVFLYSCAKRALQGPSDDKKAIVQMAYNFISDSFATSLCLRFDQQNIAAAMLDLAARLHKTTAAIPTPAAATCMADRWWRDLLPTTTAADIDDVGRLVMELYPDFQAPGSSSHAGEVELKAASTILTPSALPSAEGKTPSSTSAAARSSATGSSSSSSTSRRKKPAREPESDGGTAQSTDGHQTSSAPRFHPYERSH